MKAAESRRLTNNVSMRAANASNPLPPPSR